MYCTVLITYMPVHLHTCSCVHLLVCSPTSLCTYAHLNACSSACLHASMPELLHFECLNDWTPICLCNHTPAHLNTCKLGISLPTKLHRWTPVYPYAWTPASLHICMSVYGCTSIPEHLQAFASAHLCVYTLHRYSPTCLQA